MALALLTRADESLIAEWAGNAPVAYGYEVLLVCDTSGDSPGTPWAVFCPSMDAVSAGRDPQGRAGHDCRRHLRSVGRRCYPGRAQYRGMAG